MTQAAESWCANWRFVTEAIAPVELRMKQQAEDFVVEELPSFTASGEGEHLFLWLEKRGRSTPDVAWHLARVFGVDKKDVGWAGRKDAKAVTRQWFSVRGAASEGLERLEEHGVQLLDHTRNDRKLRLGALRGNRFALVLRGIEPQAAPRAEEVLALVKAKGLPNYYGRQRFGVAGRADELGLLLLQGRARQYLLRRLSRDHTPQHDVVDRLREVVEAGRRADQRHLGQLAGDLPREFAPLALQLARRPGDWRSALRAIDRATLGLHLSAWQSKVFNAVLSERFDGWTVPQRGDLMQLAGSNSLFEVDGEEDLLRLEERVLSFELSISGPLPGDRAPLAQGVPGELEERIRLREGAPEDGYPMPVRGLSLPGTRRALRLSMERLQWHWEGGSLHLNFDLPAGAYATCLVAELTKKP